MDDLGRFGGLLPPAAPSGRVWGLRPKDRSEERREKRKDRHPGSQGADEAPDGAENSEGYLEVIGYDRSGVRSRPSPKLNVSV